MVPYLKLLIAYDLEKYGAISADKTIEREFIWRRWRVNDKFGS